VDWETTDGELDSQPMVRGAVQVPPGGEPIVLGPDHATLGGYPVQAVVIAADHGLLGQCGPGTAVRFVPVSPEEAQEALRARRRLLAGAVVGHYPLAAG
jgi:allophanate hydrolase subunit 2